MKKIVLGIFLTLCCLTAGAQVNEQALASLVNGRQGEIGVAVIFRDKVYTVSNAGKYPLMDAFRIHVAVAAINKMENEKIPLDRKVTISPSQIHKDAVSPLRQKHPKGKIQTTYREILEYAVSYGDDIACDWLISFAGGPREIDNFIKSLGVTNFNISKTEAEMRRELNACYSNWSTPLSVVQLLKKVFDGNLLFEEHSDFLMDLMQDSSAGADKMRAGLDENTALAHIAGISDRTPKRVKVGDVDAGVITLPNGEQCYVAVLIKDSRESDSSDAKLMADIAAAVFRQIFILR